MNTSMTNSMLWRTTYAIGAYGFGALLAYGGFAVASHEDYALFWRVAGAAVLFVAALVCVILARRELRDGRSTSAASIR